MSLRQDQDSVWHIPSGELKDDEAMSSSPLPKRFEIRKRIGEGGMGIVFEAHDTQKGELVAVKIMHADLLRDSTMVELFATEAAIATSLSHPNIICVYGLHEVDGRHALVMELVHGRTLRTVMNERIAQGPAFSLSEVTTIIDQLTQALIYAHERTIHRDVKPENVWMGPEGHVKLMDFGLARLIQPDRRGTVLRTQTLTRRRMGSPYYMAPEQLHGVATIDHRIDQFAVGVIIYEMLTGELPIGLASPLAERRVDLPQRLTNAVDRALAADPSRRFLTTAAFRDEFLLGSQENPPWAPKLRTHLRAYSLTGIAVLLVALVSLTLIFGLNVWPRPQASSPSLTQEKLQRLSEVQLQAEQLQQRLSTRYQDWVAARTQKLQTVVATEATPNALMGPNILAEAQNEHAQRDRQVTIALGQWISPWVAGDEQPYQVKSLLASASQALHASESDTFDRDLASAHQEIRRRTTMLDESQAVFHARFQMEALLLGDSSQAARQARESLAESDQSLAMGDWESAKKEIQALLDHWGAPPKLRYQTLLGELESARRLWAQQFPKLGPPNLEFLGYPRAKAEAAEIWHQLGRNDRAQALLEESISTVNSWTQELVDLHERTREAWEAIPTENRLENQLGMRFVRVGSRHYWSIWETRVMDFARFIDAEGKGFGDAEDSWKYPSRPQGPTYPVVGLKPRIARAFTAWLHHNSMEAPTGGREHRIPNREVWDELLQNDSSLPPTSYKLGICADPDEFDSARWKKQWSDTSVDSSKWIGPVGRKAPDANGLYDLDGNVWEWCRDTYQAKDDADLAKAFETHALGTLYAGGSYGEGSWFGLNPAKTNIRLIARRDAIGFRIVVGVPRG